MLVGSLDLNQGKVLPGEIVGSKPEVSSHPFRENIQIPNDEILINNNIVGYRDLMQIVKEATSPTCAWRL